MVGSFAPVMYWAIRTTLCSSLQSDAEQSPYQAVMQLDGAAVELFEDLGTHDKSFQSHEGVIGFVVPSSRLSWCAWTMLVCW